MVVLSQRFIAASNLGSNTNSVRKVYSQSPMIVKTVATRGQTESAKFEITSAVILNLGFGFEEAEMKLTNAARN
jgi:hypothetical protein